jgi:hypothetical protein
MTLVARVSLSGRRHIRNEISGRRRRLTLAAGGRLGSSTDPVERARSRYAYATLTLHG